MNCLSIERQCDVIAHLADGCGIRQTERLTKTHRDTVMRLGVRVGEGCKRLHDNFVRELHVDFIEMDELWSFVGKKQKNCSPREIQENGDQFVFTAIDRQKKLLISYLVGIRDAKSARRMAYDLRERILNTPQISSDAFPAYRNAIWQEFFDGVHYGQIIKTFDGRPPQAAIDRAKRGGPQLPTVSIEQTPLIGFPVRHLISTSIIERSNLTARMGVRRLTRKTNAYSKKLENHRAAIALFVAHYNFCRVHETIGTAPAVAHGITDRPWTIQELICAAAEQKEGKEDAA